MTRPTLNSRRMSIASVNKSSTVVSPQSSKAQSVPLAQISFKVSLRLLETALKLSSLSQARLQTISPISAVLRKQKYLRNDIVISSTEETVNNANEAMQQAERDWSNFLMYEPQQVEDITDMTSSVKTVFAQFKLLKQTPNLESVNSALNVCPIMALKKIGDKYNLMYINTVPTVAAGVSSEIYEWTIFGDLPSDAVVTDLSNVFIFPADGNLMLAVDGKVWRLLSTNQYDNARLFKAILDFRYFYEETWELVCENEAFPKDTVNVIPFVANASDDKSAQVTWLILRSNFKFYRLDQSSFSSQNTWTEVSPRSPGDKQEWYVAAFDQGVVSAYGGSDHNRLYALHFDINSNTYCVDDDSDVDVKPQTRDLFSSNHLGLVSERSPGQLHHRIPLDQSGNGSDWRKDWNVWINTDNCRWLGQASPGVIMPLDVTVSYLEAFYREELSYVGDFVENLASYAFFQQYYLEDMIDGSEKYNAGVLDDDALAQTGEDSLRHMRNLSNALAQNGQDANSSTKHIEDMLNSMKEIMDVQVRRLKKDIETINKLLETLGAQQREVLSGEVGVMATSLVQILSIVLGFAENEIYGLILEGLLFGANLVADNLRTMAAADIELKMIEISETASTLSTALEHMIGVSNYYDEFSLYFDNLVEFWTQMTAFGEQLVPFENDVSVMAAFGAYLLQDKSALEKSLQTNQDLRVAATSFTETLAVNGVVSSDTVRIAKGKTERLLIEAKKAQKVGNKTIFREKIRMAELTLGRSFANHAK